MSAALNSKHQVNVKFDFTGEISYSMNGNIRFK